MEKRRRGEFLAQIKTASSGFPMAVAYCHYQGWNGMEQDEKKAFEMFVKIEQETNGYQWAQYLLGECYRFGFGTDQDHTKAVEWYTKSSEQENSGAMNNLGVRYEKGQGCDQNMTKAVEWYEKSAQLGNSVAMYNLGNCYTKGDGVAKDLTKAREWYTKAAAQGDEYAQTSIETLETEVKAAELENADASASLSGLDEIERETSQGNDGEVVGETKNNGGVVGETQLGPALNDQLRATNKN